MNIFKELGTKTGLLVAEKNKAYGDSVRKAAKIMMILYPNGISCAQIPNALLTVRVLDKLSRIANDPEYNNEDPAMDITGYGILWQELIKNGLTKQDDGELPGQQTFEGFCYECQETTPGIREGGGNGQDLHVRELSDGEDPRDVRGGATTNIVKDIEGVDGLGNRRSVLRRLARDSARSIQKVAEREGLTNNEVLVKELNQAIRRECSG